MALLITKGVGPLPRMDAKTGEVRRPLDRLLDIRPAQTVVPLNENSLREEPRVCPSFQVAPEFAL